MTSLLQVRMHLDATAEAVVEHGQDILATSDRMLDLGALQIHDQAVIPNVVIFGFGDSGTRGVRLMMQHLGISMCSYTVPGLGGVDTKDNVLTWPTQSFTTMLQGSRKGYKSSPFFKAAVLTERSGAQNTLDCIIEDMSLKNASLPIGFKWGFKNPRHAYLMPVMDVAFHSKHKVVMVARDFRDLCTADNTGQYGTYGEIVLGELVDEKSLAQCMRFLASVWASVLQEYGDDENFLVVRIEDLVMPDPKASNTSQLILKRIMEHAADISPSTEQLQEELKEPHAHRDSFMGHHYGMTLAERTTLEIKTASYTGEVHEMMKALGYHTHHYGLIDPSHPRVLSPSAFL
mmetsp:Transcript_891/g.1842  ORF Transcript_891/g.1842 Transcript_891/m.1842 type:complete len:346 (+) Transcript_891:1-1038(+)